MANQLRDFQRIPLENLMVKKKKEARANAKSNGCKTKRERNQHISETLNAKSKTANKINEA